MSLASLGLSVLSLRLLWRRDFPGALDLGMTQWTAFLAIFLIFAVPHWDRENWRPLADPYAVALRLEAKGAVVVAGQLTETQLGFASLRLRHRLPTADDAPAAAQVLTGDQPVALLAEPGYWSREASLGHLGTVVPTAATALRPSMRNRAPLLVLNPAALRLLDH
jgi:hypothetical protein